MYIYTDRMLQHCNQMSMQIYSKSVIYLSECRTLYSKVSTLMDLFWHEKEKEKYFYNLSVKKAYLNPLSL